ncbi:MAG: hypothetical protein WKG07_33600 [Hymenobacter sp.]
MGCWKACPWSWPTSITSPFTPAGARFWRTIETELGLTRHDNRHAYRVLRDSRQHVVGHGAVCARATLLAPLPPADHGAPVLSFAFGPGLTHGGHAAEASCVEISRRPG